MGILKRRAILIMRRFVRFLLLGMLSFVLATACASNSAPPKNSLSSPSSTDCKTFQHEFGETQICGQPERIIAFDPPALDMLLSLEVQPVGIAGSQPTGYTGDPTITGSLKPGDAVDGVRYLGDRLTIRPTYIGTSSMPSLETVLKLKPDLILSRYINNESYATLSKIAPVLPLKTDLIDWQQDFLILAQVLNRESQAQQVIEQYQQTLANTKIKLQPVNQNTKLLILDMTSMDNVSIITSKNYMGFLLQNLGFQIVITQSSSDLGIIPVSLEYLPQLEPDLVVVLERGQLAAQVKNQWRQNPILQSVASQADHLLFADFYLWATLEGPIGAKYMIEDIQAQLNKD
ncbi:MAG: iron-siderophore ABC transporter substrate-binding protein [Elainellaceae cyanobacterium]